MQRLQADRQFVGGVLAGVVKDHHFLHVVPDSGGDPLEDLGEGGNGVISDDEDPDALAVVLGKFGIQRGGFGQRR